MVANKCMYHYGNRNDPQMKYFCNILRSVKKPHVMRVIIFFIDDEFAINGNVCEEKVEILVEKIRWK